MKRLFILALLAATPLVGGFGNGGFGHSVFANEVHDELVERGRYLIKVSGCNDCHTAGYLMANGETPVSDWLTGDNLGWNGPWGTTYGSNLRVFVQHMSETQWVQAAKSLRRAPPMPWFNLNSMEDDDLIAIYHFIKSLGDVGEPAPAALPPGVQPPAPYATFPAP